MAERLPTAMRLERAFDDPNAVRRLIEANGPFASIASYLPASATGVRPGGDEPDDVLPWFRSNWAVNGHCTVDGAEAILTNQRFIEAARRFLRVEAVVPSTVVINVNAPMRAGAIHQDIPAFRGAGRDQYPLPLLQAMGASGLFEPWRIIEVGAVAWFYAGAGGAYDYWPDGLDAPMVSERPPFDNVALLADNDRMYHRIGWVGDERARRLPISAGATIDHAAGRWTIRDQGSDVVGYADEDVRLSVLWKARPAIAATDPAPLSPEQIVEIIDSDLRARNLSSTHSDAPMTDEEWIGQVHAIYYRTVAERD